MEFPKRKLPRLKNYDYRIPGVYFITICTHDKMCLFGKVLPDGVLDEPQMQLSAQGQAAKSCLLAIESHYQNIKVDNWVVMPNHVHMLLRITEPADPVPAYDISNVVGKYKAAVTRTVGNIFMHSEKIWQASFYDHIIRNEDDYKRIWQYIADNPARWTEDCFYCE